MQALLKDPRYLLSYLGFLTPTLSINQLITTEDYQLLLITTSDGARAPL
jgi:hypothetical protein